ncbi:hypothetical protein ACET3Z_015416 [Daucus carota]
MKCLYVIFMLLILTNGSVCSGDEVNHDHKSILERVEEQTYEGVEKVKETAKGVNSKLKDVYEKTKGADLDTPKRVLEDIERNVSTGLGSAKEFVQRVTKGGMQNTEEGVKGKHGYSKDWKASILGVLHLLGLSMAFGMSMWMRFVSCYILGDVLPRKQFALVETKMYPVYFRIQACCIGIVFTAHILSHGPRVFSNFLEVLHALNITVALLMSIGKILYLEPLATRIKSRRQKLEKDAGRGRVTSRPSSGIADDAGDPVTATTERQEEAEGERETCMASEQVPVQTSDSRKGGQESSASEPATEEIIRPACKAHN